MDQIDYDECPYCHGGAAPGGRFTPKPGDTVDVAALNRQMAAFAKTLEMVAEYDEFMARMRNDNG